MIDELANGLVLAMALYAAIGLAVAVPFVSIGAPTVDPAARQTSFGFRLLILPGSVAFWPLLLRRWLERAPPPEESNAHRRRARRPAVRR